MLVADKTKRAPRKRSGAPELIASVSFSVVVCSLLLICIFLKPRSAAAVDAAVSDGRAYLQSLTENDPAKVDDVLRERRRLQQEQNKIEEMIRQIENDEVDIWSLYQDYVLLGDSRGEGFSFFSFLQKSHVLAETGSSIYKAYDHMPRLRAMKPSFVYLCYGINDIEMPGAHPDADYAEVVRDVLAKIHDASPDAVVVVSSILQVKDTVLERQSEFKKVPLFNAALKELCDEIPYAVYADNDELTKTHTDLYEPDGIHFVGAFYPLWAKNMYISILNNQIVEKQQESEKIRTDEK